MEDRKAIEKRIRKDNPEITVQEDTVVVNKRTGERRVESKTKKLTGAAKEKAIQERIAMEVKRLAPTE